MVRDISSDGDRNNNSELPSGWIQVKFIESVKKISLTDKKLKQSDYLEIGDIPVVDQGQTLIGGYTNREDLKNSSIEPIIIFGDHTKVIKYINFDFVAGADGVKPFHAQLWYNPKFLFFLLHSIDLPDKGYARHFQYLEKIYLPLPPLPEQHRIVTKIEELFTQLDAGVASLKKVQAQLKRYRQAVLKAAFDGRLTHEWREQHEKDDEIFIEFLKRNWEKYHKGKKFSHLNSSELPCLPKGWIWATFDQVSQRVTVGHVGPMKDEYIDQGVPFLRSQNVRANKFDPHGLKYISPEFHKIIKKSILNPNDLVVVRSGNVGVSCVIPEYLKEANCSDLVIVKQPFGILPNLGAYYMNSTALRLVNAKKVGVALTHFNTKSMADMVVPLPPLEEQKILLTEIERLFSIADEIEKTITISLRQAETLRQSILKRAFEGKLVPQDPTDEPASILLEKIKAEKARHAADAKEGKTLQPTLPKRMIKNAN